MQISEQELRTMIRTAIARHAGGSDAEAPTPTQQAAPAVHVHFSHGQFPIVGSSDGACVIEPDHRCDHCGYCKSLGH